MAGEALASFGAAGFNQQPQNSLGQMSAFATSLQVSGNLLNSVAGFYSAFATNSAQKYAMQVAQAQGEAEAAEAIKRGQFERDRILAEGQKAAGSALATGTASGVDMTTGTGLAMMKEIIDKSSADAMQAALQGEIGAINARLSAKVSGMSMKAQGSQVKMQGLQQGFTSLLGASMAYDKGTKAYESAKHYSKG